MKKILKRKRFGIILIALLIIGVTGYIGILSMQTDLSFEDIGKVEPGIKVYPDHVRIYGAVPINQVYVTGANQFIDNRTLYINLKGYNIPLSKIEGEYYYEIEVDSDDYDKVVYLGLDNEGDKVLYRAKYRF